MKSGARLVASMSLAIACEGKPIQGPDAPIDTTRPDEAKHAAAEPTPTPKPPVTVPECPRFAVAREIAKLADPSITEASGLVASRRQPGVLWVHNDSGDGPRVYAVDTTGATRGTFKLDRGNAFDWEDLAIGPGPEPDRDYLYLGDIGDNVTIRPSVTVYRIAEPDVGTVVEPRNDTNVADDFAIELRYPDGSHDAETLMSDPLTGDLFVVTKVKLQVGVYRAPAPLTDSMTLELVATLGPTDLAVLDARITGGEISPDGRLVGVRTYGGVRLWHRIDGESIADAMKRRPCSADVPRAGGGEAFAWLPGTAREPSTDGFLLVNEGRSSPLWRADRLP